MNDGESRRPINWPHTVNLQDTLAEVSTGSSVR